MKYSKDFDDFYTPSSAVTKAYIDRMVNSNMVLVVDPYDFSTRWVDISKREEDRLSRRKRIIKGI